MKRLKKWTAVTMLIAVLACTLTACSKEKKPENGQQDNNQNDTAQNNSNTDNNQAANGKGRVYYLNFKPEVADVWEKIAAEYTKETGVPVKVVTAASGEYEKTLKSEMAKKEAPTLFHINGPVGYQTWKDYTMDLKDTNLYSWLNTPDLAISEDGGVFGVPFVVEGYGIIYNDDIMQKYFALTDKAVDITSVDQINNFATLKAVAEDMTAKKDQLGIKGVFASTSFSAGNDWRWQTHLMNLPMYYEFKESGNKNPDMIAFTYNENFKNIFDLYLNNSLTAPEALGSKSVDDSMGEFARGEAAMVQNGNWGWSEVQKAEGNTVKEENIKFLPIYIGADGEEKQGLCIGTENFLSVNSQASADDQKASIAFMEWVFSSDKGKEFVSKDLGFITPFTTFEDAEKPVDPLAREVDRYMKNTDLYTVTWDFTAFPSQEFKNMLGADLLSYAQGNLKWEELVKNTTQNWADEKEMSAQ